MTLGEALGDALARALDGGMPAVLVTVAEATGSTPRAAGARMLVTADGIAGSIGGGRLEWEAAGRARAMIAGAEAAAAMTLPLGPALGQCCGGHVVLALRRADAGALDALRAAERDEAARRPAVLVLGAGHVGTALVRALAPLPVAVTWSDTRPGQLPADAGVATDSGDPVELVRAAPPGAAAVVMTHSHALDYAITEAALARRDLAYVGLIGSRTKRRRFERWFGARGGDARALGALVCPIGDAGVADKRPAVIAALTAAELVRCLLREAAEETMGAGSASPRGADSEQRADSGRRGRAF